MKPDGRNTSGANAARGKTSGVRVQVSCSPEEAALLRQLAGRWGVTPAAAIRRLIREASDRHGLGPLRSGPVAPAVADAPTAGRGEDWVATLGYAVPPIWDAMQSHLSVLTERFREQWSGFGEGATHPATDRNQVSVQFSLPEGTASAADLRAWLAEEWAQIARDAGPVEVEDAPTWSARQDDRAA